MKIEEFSALFQMVKNTKQRDGEGGIKGAVSGIFFTFYEAKL